MRTKLYYLLLICFFLLIVGGCSSIHKHGAKGGGWYQVKLTDTLYSIAWRYGLDYEDLARWNDISSPYQIHPGQQLILIKPNGLPKTVKSKKVVKRSTIKNKKETNIAYSSKKVNWRWPTQGKVLNKFSFKALDKHGINIAGKLGQAVYAVADGKVVYSGTGLAGYGNLIIVKHNETFLSAYAYNRKRLVKEGFVVKQGHKIAEMGSKNDKTMLHFQIRKKGKPVNPLWYLPKK